MTPFAINHSNYFEISLNFILLHLPKKEVCAFLQLSLNELWIDTREDIAFPKGINQVATKQLCVY